MGALSRLRSDLPWIAAVLGGIAAGMHMWKVSPFVPVLRGDFAISLTDAGLLIAVVQLAGVLGGLLFGILIESLGVRRSIVIGLVSLTVASVIGGFVDSFAWLLALRAIESFGYMLTIVSAPALVRRVAETHRLTTAMGWWASYQGLASGLTLASAALFVGVVSWQVWWLGTAAVSAAAVALILLVVPADEPHPQRRTARDVFGALRRTVSFPAPWLVGITFTSYALSWIAVIGFLPTVYDAAGIDPRTAGLLTAFASAVNIVGAFVGAFLIRTKLGPRGVVWIGAAAMGIGGWVVFASNAPFAVTYIAVSLFSAVGGLIPAVLTRLAVESAPASGSLPIALGLVQQLANLGMFIGPIIAGLVVDLSGTWSHSWLINVIAAAFGATLIVFATNHRFGVSWRRPESGE